MPCGPAEAAGVDLLASGDTMPEPELAGVLGPPGALLGASGPQDGRAVGPVPGDAPALRAGQGEPRSLVQREPCAVRAGEDRRAAPAVATGDRPQAAVAARLSRRLPAGRAAHGQRGVLPVRPLGGGEESGGGVVAHGLHVYRARGPGATKFAPLGRRPPYISASAAHPGSDAPPHADRANPRQSRTCGRTVHFALNFSRFSQRASANPRGTGLSALACLPSPHDGRGAMREIRNDYAGMSGVARYWLTRGHGGGTRGA